MRLPVAAACLFAIAAYAVDAGHPLRGYTPEDSATEVSWEQKFRQLPDRDHIRENMRRLSARPHHVGSPYDKDNAEWLLAQLKSFGLDAKIETFSALFPTPKSRKLELLGPTPFTAKLAGTCPQRRSHLQPNQRAVADVQRLFPRRRCHRPSGLRELRPP